MLAELAAFNAGFAVIKQTIANGKDITSALGSLSKMIGAEEDLRARGNRKKNNIWTKVAGKSADDFSEFVSLNEIKNKRKELESMVRLYASFSWDDFIVYEAKMRKKRKEEAEEREKAIARMVSLAQWGLARLIVFGTAFSLLYWAYVTYGWNSNSC